MKYIQKNDAPEAFEKWKNQNPKPKKWDDFPSSKKKINERETGIAYYSKEELRSVLHEEQGGACAYCERKIYDDISSVL